MRRRASDIPATKTGWNSLQHAFLRHSHDFRTAGLPFFPFSRLAIIALIFPQWHRTHTRISPDLLRPAGPNGFPSEPRSSGLRTVPASHSVPGMIAASAIRFLVDLKRFTRPVPCQSLGSDAGRTGPVSPLFLRVPDPRTRKSLKPVPTTTHEGGSQTLRTCFPWLLRRVQKQTGHVFPTSKAATWHPMGLLEWWYWRCGHSPR